MIKETQKIKKILVPHGAIGKMAAHFGISRESVRAALEFRTHSDLAYEIRNYSTKQLGGQVSQVEVLA